MASGDPYNTLGVAKSATQEEIRAAYKKLAVKTHPDKTGGDDTKFKEVVHAYETLSDPEKRRAHDSGGFFAGGMPGGFRGGFPGGFPAGFESFFSDMNRRSAPCDPFQVSIPLSAIVKGTRQRITVSMPHMCNECSGNGTRDTTLCVSCHTCKGVGRVTQSLGGVFSIALGTCPACKGKGKNIPSAAKCKGCAGEGVVSKQKTIDIDIPPGTPDGHSFVMEEAGAYDPGLGNNRHVKITVKWSIPGNVRIYDRDIHTSITCTLDEVLAGYKKVVNLYGEPVEISRDAYANPTTPIVKRGLGIQGGDLVVNITVKWPEFREGQPSSQT